MAGSAKVGEKDVFDRWKVLVAACGFDHTTVTASACPEWSRPLDMCQKRIRCTRTARQSRQEEGGWGGWILISS